jgi:hypothetical protein
MNPETLEHATATTTAGERDPAPGGAQPCAANQPPSEQIAYEGRSLQLSSCSKPLAGPSKTTRPSKHYGGPWQPQTPGTGHAPGNKGRWLPGRLRLNRLGCGRPTEFLSSFSPALAADFLELLRAPLGAPWGPNRPLARQTMPRSLT